MKIRQHIQFFGRVQGVGFRYTAYHLACSLGLTGWVYNEWDGSVQMEVQGEKHSIDVMLERLDSSAFICIDSMKKATLPVITSDSCFEVRGD